MSTEQLEFDIGDNEEATTVEMNEEGLRRRGNGRRRSTRGKSRGQ